jgi:hypothetical protein
MNMPFNAQTYDQATPAIRQIRMFVGRAVPYVQPCNRPWSAPLGRGCSVAISPMPAGRSCMLLTTPSGMLRNRCFLLSGPAAQ